MLTLSLQRKDQSSVPTEVQMKLILAQTLSSPSFYNAPVIVLDFEVDDNGTSKGRFRDAVKPRVFSFEIAKSGVSYKPFTPGRLDSLIIEEWEEFSEGYSYRIDAATTNRTGKPNCNETISMPCGKACVSLKKNCKTNPKDPVSAARKENAIAATKVYSKATKTAKKASPLPTEKEPKAKAKKAKPLPPEIQQETPPPPDVTEKTTKTESPARKLKASKMTPKEAFDNSKNWIKSNWEFLSSKKEEDVKKRPLIYDADIVLWMLNEQGRKPAKHLSVTALKDENGGVQGFFMTNSQKSKAKESLYIEALSTNPQNIINETKGVGKQIIYNAIKESMKKGFKGKISLSALENAVPFYEAVGFKKKGDHDYDLSEEDATAFIEKYEKSLKSR